MNHADMQRQVAELQMSPTMGLLCRFAQSMPIDPKDPEDIKTALTTATLDLVRALDAKRIHFEHDEDNAMLHGLLLVAMQVIFDGRFADAVKMVRPQ